MFITGQGRPFNCVHVLPVFSSEKAPAPCSSQAREDLSIVSMSFLCSLRRRPRHHVHHRPGKTFQLCPCPSCLLFGGGPGTMFITGQGRPFNCVHVLPVFSSEKAPAPCSSQAREGISFVSIFLYAVLSNFKSPTLRFLLYNNNNNNNNTIIATIILLVFCKQSNSLLISLCLGTVLIVYYFLQPKRSEDLRDHRNYITTLKYDYPLK